MRSTFLESLREVMATWFSRLGCTKKRCAEDWENRWSYSLRFKTFKPFKSFKSFETRFKVQGLKSEELSYDAQRQRPSFANARYFVCGDRDSAGVGFFSDSATAHRGR